MSVTTANLVLGPATFYVGLFGSVTEPADTAVNLTPAASSGFTDAGGTSGGVNLEISPKFSDLEVDQIVDVLGSRLTSREMMITTSFAEVTLANLTTALNNLTSAATGAGYSALDLTSPSSASQPTYAALLIDGWAPSSPFRRRLLVRKVLSTAKTGLAYTKDKQTLIPVTFKAYYVSSGTSPIHIVDQTS